jgi:rfaE bifunctional protein kinase chain/domain
LRLKTITEIMFSKVLIADLSGKFSRMKALVIGDVMVDSYIWGKVERISPEAPVPIVSVQKRENRLGGAANVALNLQSLGAKPIICTVIGYDQRGKDFVNLLKKQKLSSEGIIKSKKRVTTTKFRVIGNNSQLLRVDEEIEDSVSKEDSDKLYNRIRNLAVKNKIDVIIFEDYDKGVIDEQLIEKVVKIAKSKNIPVTADPKKKNFLKYKGISLFKPNLKELKEGLKLDFEKIPGDKGKKINSEILEAINKLHLKNNIDLVLLTLASEGVFISEKQKNKNELIPAHKRNIADVSGAGDTVISVASLCLAAGLEAGNIARISNLAGGLVCEEVGVVPINRNILFKAIMTDC